MIIRLMMLHLPRAQRLRYEVGTSGTLSEAHQAHDKRGVIQSRAHQGCDYSDGKESDCREN